MMSEALLFVYGTLRPGFDGEMAAWLASVSRRIGPASAKGRLYRVDGYPGFAADAEGRVAGDLLLLTDPTAALAILDEHEECAPHFPEPHEYRRERLAVECGGRTVEAWTYVYALDISGLERIESGDFLS